MARLGNEADAREVRELRERTRSDGVLTKSTWIGRSGAAGESTVSSAYEVDRRARRHGIPDPTRRTRSGWRSSGSTSQAPRKIVIGASVGDFIHRFFVQRRRRIPPPWKPRYCHDRQGGADRGRPIERCHRLRAISATAIVGGINSFWIGTQVLQQLKFAQLGPPTDVHERSRGPNDDRVEPETVCCSPRRDEHLFDGIAKPLELRKSAETRVVGAPCKEGSRSRQDRH